MGYQALRVIPSAKYIPAVKYILCLLRTAMLFIVLRSGYTLMIFSEQYIIRERVLSVNTSHEFAGRSSCAIIRYVYRHLGVKRFYHWQKFGWEPRFARINLRIYLIDTMMSHLKILIKNFFGAHCSEQWGRSWTYLRAPAMPLAGTSYMIVI